MIAATTLTDGGQTPAAIARLVQGFVGAARETLDLALYDVRLPDDAGTLAVGAIEAAHRRGVAVRVLFNVDHPGPIPVPPPPEAEPDDIESLDAETRGVSGIPDLMHHKYAIRDGEAVWTGSANWTGDSWSRQENVIVTVQSREVAAAYSANFEQLWRRRGVEGTGTAAGRPVRVGDSRVRAWFTPEGGEELAQEIARRIGTAGRRLRIASPVITSGPVLGTLAQVAAERKVDLAGVVDWTQVSEVVGQWRANGRSAWKIPILASALSNARFSGKRSTPYAPDAVHDYMHAKLVVADDTVFAGSFNLSRSGEFNAENVLQIDDAALADGLAAYVDSVRVRYPAVDGSLFTES